MRPQTHGDTTKFKNLKLLVQLYLYKFFDSFGLSLSFFYFLFFIFYVRFLLTCIHPTKY